MPHNFTVRCTNVQTLLCADPAAGVARSAARAPGIPQRPVLCGRGTFSALHHTVHVSMAFVCDKYVPAFRETWHAPGCFLSPVPMALNSFYIYSIIYILSRLSVGGTRAANGGDDCVAGRRCGGARAGAAVHAPLPLLPHDRRHRCAIHADVRKFRVQRILLASPEIVTQRCTAAQSSAHAPCKW